MKISITTILLLVTGLASAQSMPTPSKTRTLETIKFEKILSWED